MSYRNPARIVDTQSGQHFRNMQQSLAKTFTGVIDADTARIIKEAEKAEKEQSLVIQRIEKDNQAAVDAAIQSSVESGTSTVWNLQPSLKANARAISLKPGQRTEEDMNVIGNMNNLKAKLMSAMSNPVSYEETYKSVIAKQIGSEGGLNRYSKTNADKIKGLSIFYDGKNGRSAGDYDAVTGTVSLKAYWKGEGEEELSTEILSDGVDIELDTVPETKQARVDMTASLLKMMKLEKGNSDVFIGSKVTDRVEEGTNTTKWSRQPTREAVEKALYPDALATVMGMSAAEGIVWSNNRSGMGPKVDGFITSSYTDEEKYVKNDEDVMVPRPEIVAIAKALAKNAVDTEGQELLANIEYAGVGAPKDTKPEITSETKRNVEALGESIKTDPFKVFKGRKFGTSGKYVEDVEFKDGKIKVILDDGTINIKEKGVSTTKMKTKEIDYDLSDTADVQNLARTLYKENSPEYNALLNYLYLDISSKTGDKPNNEPLVEMWKPE